jgi:DNA (cytosine-5)-methyltransferase 1
VRSFDGRVWRGLVDVVSGGFPCQDIAPPGTHAGIDGERSGLWSEFKRIVCEVRPRFVFVENSSNLALRGISRVLGDLASLGFHARWGVLGASDLAGNQHRKRMWIFAYAVGNGLEGRNDNTAQQDGKAAHRSIQALAENRAWPEVSDPRAYGSSDVVAHRMDRLKALGNGQIPAVAAAAFKVLRG